MVGQLAVIICFNQLYLLVARGPDVNQVKSWLVQVICDGVSVLLWKNVYSLPIKITTSKAVKNKTGSVLTWCQLLSTTTENNPFNKF